MRYIQQQRIIAQQTPKFERIHKRRPKVFQKIFFLSSNGPSQKPKTFLQYERGQKIIQNNQLPLFKIKKRKDILSRQFRVQTQANSDRYRCPVSPVFEEYISRSLQRRKYFPSKLASMHRNEYEESVKAINKIFLQPAQIGLQKKFKPPLRNHLQQKYQKIRALEKHQDCSHPLYQKSVSVDVLSSQKSLREHQDIKLQSKFYPLKAKRSHQIVNKAKIRSFSRRYQPCQEPPDTLHLQPWSVYNDENF